MNKFQEAQLNPAKKSRIPFYLVVLVLLLIADAILWFSPYSEFKIFRQKTPKLSINDAEFIKLDHILDKFRVADITVIYNGDEYTPEDFWVRAKNYLLKNFTLGDKARAWVEEHCYRTKKGDIIYFKYPDGSYKPMRDIFLAELQMGESLSPNAHAPSVVKQTSV